MNASRHRTHHMKQHAIVTRPSGPSVADIFDERHSPAATKDIVPVVAAAVRHRDYTFLGTTQSLCPECLAVVPAKIIARGKRVYFRKTCPEHGSREDFVCSDVGLSLIHI